MKKIFFLIALVSSIAACQSNKAPDQKDIAKAAQDTANYTTIQWVDSLIDLGNIKHGEKAIATFRFKNIGNHPLIIQDVRPGCGCTIADYTKEPLQPGKEGSVVATFHSDRSNAGTIHKSLVVLTANTKNQKEFVLAFKGNVIENKDANSK